jgi:hypothetical protein
MTILQDIERLVVRLSPQPVCDDCIADTLMLAIRDYASRKSRELAGSHGFERCKDMCTLCGATKWVIRKR